jgi:hypothetical protein
MTEKEDAISWGEQPTSVRLESNLLYNLQTQRRQIVINRLKAKSVFDEPLEIDDEILQLTTDLDSVLGSELNTPPHRIHVLQRIK